VQNYLLVAHVAALRAILRRHAKELPAAQVNAMLTESHDQVVDVLEHALDPRNAAVRAAASQAGDEALMSASTLSAQSTAAAQVTQDAQVPWSGWPLVQRRIRLLQQDAVKIIVHREAILRDLA